MSAITCYKHYGVTRNQVASMCINLFHYPVEYIDTLDEYYILHWTPHYFLTQLKSGIITRPASVSSTTVSGKIITGGHETNTVDYLAVYKDCTPVKIKKSNGIKLSFRKPLSDFQVSPYVLVSLIEHTNQFKLTL